MIAKQRKACRALYGCALVALAVLAETAVAQYSCDPKTCVLPKCHCASTDPPVVDPPQFVQLTFDDAIQANTYPLAAKKLLDGRKNPNGCGARATWYVSTDYTDYFMVTQWYAQGHEVAVHTMSHVFPTALEVTGCRAALHSFGGLPFRKITGFRHPFLDYSAASMSLLYDLGYAYESSIPSDGDVRHWPYTLDSGVAHGCDGAVNLCTAGVSLPGMWEIPMHPIRSTANPPVAYTMDANLGGSASEVMSWLKATFDAHYNGNRAPFGLYLHPVWFSGALPPPAGAPSAAEQVSLLNEFLDYIQSKPDVYMVTSQQLISYMQNPVSKTQIASQPYMNCPAGQQGICNGLNDISTAQACNFINGTIHTCYGCPSNTPGIGNIDKMISSLPATKGPVPDTCDTAWWDPDRKVCSCTSAECAWKELAPILNTNPNSAKNLTAPSNNVNGTVSRTNQDGALNGSASASPMIETGSKLALSLLIPIVLFFTWRT